MSLLETAKRHDLNTEKYITYLLEHLPNEKTLAKKEMLEAYLPWNETIQKIVERKTLPESTKTLEVSI
ncbi:transposase domain-containing protein [Streptococcus sp. S784/96/1]|uniref:transposase domain-containing protein n=1 Tax=Streptococcus sp. S784/96/1 TaxID=2653499 RepID=UPI001386830D|nr:transposase domain-containing protein [Streptococcus sp. S784/96/1]